MNRGILYIDTPVHVGGAEQSLLTLISNLDPKRYHAELVTTMMSELVLQAQIVHIPVHVQEFAWFSRRRPWRYWTSILNLSHTIRSNNIALVHTNCDKSLPYAMVACRLTGVPLVAHVRDFVRSWFDGNRLKALKQAQLVVANSKAIKEASIAAGINRERIEVIYNPIDTLPFTQVETPAIKSLYKELGLPQDALIIGLVGQIDPIKGHEEFIEAAGPIVDQVPNAWFIVVGATYSDEQKFFERQLNDLVKNRNLQHRFLFTGYRRDIPVVMNLIDILIVPSWKEPFGRVVVEGLAAGCAVIGSDSGGIPEIIDHEISGLLVQPRNPEAITTAVLKIVRGPDFTDQLIKNGRKRSLSFGVSQHLLKIQAIYDCVLGENLSTPTMTL